ncbi:MAG: hypothetical protein NDI69_12385 [Bacteriovoracaceae bacterium]|nr:hypothetical protein [Bacteriovoracaceae bacterium]
MRTSLFHGLLCASLVFFAAGCGKDNKSSGGGVSGNVVTNPYTGTVPADSLTAYTNLMTWYKGTTEGSLPNDGFAHYGETRTITTLSQECSTKTIDLWIIEKDLTFCKENSSENEVERNVALTAVGSVKASNSKLTQALSGSGLTLIKVTQYSANVFQIEWAKSNGHRLAYSIDTSFNSAFNPYQIIDSEARTIESLTDIGSPFLNL